jgi:hypothetical protein
VARRALTVGDLPDFGRRNNKIELLCGDFFRAGFWFDGLGELKVKFICTFGEEASFGFVISV